MMKTINLLKALAAIPILLAVACAGSAPSAKSALALDDPAEYRIGPDDLLQIVVWKNEALTQTVPVRPDGKISLPLLNDLQAVGLTPLELQRTLVEKLAPYMPKPEVSVIVQEVRSFKVSVIGEVKEAGRYEIKGPATVLDMLAQAGGLSEFASPSRIVVLRQEAGTTRRIPFNYKKAVSREAGHENYYLRPGDIIVVP